jgi:TonB-dependent starch-binding outer membrane protein SusC
MRLIRLDRVLALTGFILAAPVAAGALVMDAPEFAGGVLAPEIQAAQVGTITGRVIGTAGNNPIAGAHVQIVGTNIGTQTNADGRFSMANIPAGQVQLRVNMLGYGSADRPVTVRAGETVTLEIALERQALGLDEIVVTGTAGQARRREVGNTIAQINMAEVRQPATSMDQLLSGRSTGLTVTPSGGSLGAGAQIRLRGNVSMTLSNQPLIYVDGVRQSADSYARNVVEGGPTFLGNASQSPINDINPRDIDRIEIVKGAAATTLYGSEAASGVIQIFTKRGQQGGASFTYQTDQTFDRVRPFGSSVRPYMNMESFLRTGYTQSHSISMSGGGSEVRYFLSALLTDGKGVLPNDEERRIGIRGNLTTELTDNLTLDWNTSYSTSDMQLTHSGGNLHGLEFNAFRAPNNNVGSGDPEVMGRLLDSKAFQVNNRLNTGLTLNWSPRGNLTNRLTLGLDRSTADMRQETPYGFIVAADGLIGRKEWSSEGRTLDYVGSLRASLTESLRTTFSWGGQVIEREEMSLDAFGIGLPGPGRHTISSAAERTTFASELRVITGGFFLQNLFDLRDKYFLTVGLRVDGNSAFGQDLGLESYPKVSGSWVLSEEDFWNESLGSFRIRGAFGYSGRAPGAFDAARTWAPQSFSGQSAFIPANIGNPNLGPERTREVEVGFESSWLEDRLRVDFTYYDQLTSDALFLVPQLPSNGFTGSQLENVGSFSNKGVEVEMSMAMLQRPGLAWDLGASLTTNHSNVIDTGGQTFFQIIPGHPAPVNRGTRVLNPDELADPIYEFDAIRGPNQPTHIVGANSSVTFAHGINLSARTEFQGGHEIRDGASSGAASRGAGAPACDDNAYQIVPFDAFPNHPGVPQLTALERARCYGQRAGADFRIWHYPADFLKLRDLTLMVPLGFVGVRAENLTFTASLSNILLYKHRDMALGDPESAFDMTALERHINTFTPSPARLAFSLRARF